MTNAEGLPSETPTQDPPWSVGLPPSFGGVIYLRKNGHDDTAERTLVLHGGGEHSEENALWLASELNGLERLRRGVQLPWAERAKAFAKDCLRGLPPETPHEMQVFMAEMIMRTYLKGVDDRGASQ
jgi:hypothetical protein